MSIAMPPEEDDGWFSLLPKRNQCTEVGVGRHHDAIVALGSAEDLFVGGSRELKVADVNGVMAILSQPFRDDWRQGIVDEKSHGTVSGNPRWRTASAA